MRGVLLDTSEKDENGKIVFKIKGFVTIPQSEIDSTVKRVKAASEMIERMSRVDLNKLNKQFTI